MSNRKITDDSVVIELRGTASKPVEAHEEMPPAKEGTANPAAEWFASQGFPTKLMD